MNCATNKPAGATKDADGQPTGERHHLKKRNRPMPLAARLAGWTARTIAAARLTGLTTAATRATRLSGWTAATARTARLAGRNAATTRTARTGAATIARGPARHAPDSQPLTATAETGMTAADSTEGAASVQSGGPASAAEQVRQKSESVNRQRNKIAGFINRTSHRNGTETKRKRNSKRKRKLRTPRKRWRLRRVPLAKCCQPPSSPDHPVRKALRPATLQPPRRRETFR